LYVSATFQAILTTEVVRKNCAPVIVNFHTLSKNS